MESDTADLRRRFVASAVSTLGWSEEKAAQVFDLLAGPDLDLLPVLEDWAADLERKVHGVLR